jgi:hypothetical protein
MIPNFVKEERPKPIVIWVVDRPKLLPLSDAETKVLELAFPFAETGLHQDATFSMQFATIEGEIAQAGKKRHRAEDATRRLYSPAPQPARNSWLYFGLD